MIKEVVDLVLFDGGKEERVGYWRLGGLVDLLCVTIDWMVRKSGVMGIGNVGLEKQL